MLSFLAHGVAVVFMNLDNTFSFFFLIVAVLLRFVRAAVVMRIGESGAIGLMEVMMDTFFRKQ